MHIELLILNSDTVVHRGHKTPFKKVLDPCINKNAINSKIEHSTLLYFWPHNGPLTENFGKTHNKDPHPLNFQPVCNYEMTIKGKLFNHFFAGRRPIRKCRPVSLASSSSGPQCTSGRPTQGRRTISRQPESEKLENKKKKFLKSLNFKSNNLLLKLDLEYTIFKIHGSTVLEVIDNFC